MPRDRRREFQSRTAAPRRTTSQTRNSVELELQHDSRLRECLDDQPRYDDRCWSRGPRGLSAQLLDPDRNARRRSRGPRIADTQEPLADAVCQLRQVVEIYGSGPSSHERSLFPRQIPNTSHLHDQQPERGLVLVASSTHPQESAVENRASGTLWCTRRRGAHATPDLRPDGRSRWPTRAHGISLR